MDEYKEFRLALAELLVNLKGWNFDFDYRLTKREAETVKKVGELLKRLDMRVDLKEIYDGETQNAYIIPSIPFGATNEDALRTLYPAMTVAECGNLGEWMHVFLNSNHNDGVLFAVHNTWLQKKYTRPNFQLFLQRWAKGETND